jgi:putative acetyltransferase
MDSIQQLCAKDYTQEEIQAWGGRPFDKEARERAIEKEYVWVLEHDEQIKGYAQLEIVTRNGFKEGYVWGLYLVSEIAGHSWGRELFATLLAQAHTAEVAVLRLDATLTAYDFYKEAGFRDAGPEIHVVVSGVKIRCRPMVFRF